MDDSPIPTFAELAADPEIAALLDFDPVPREIVRPNGWTPERQRRFIAFVAHFGCPKAAADAVGKSRQGVGALHREKGADSFRDAWNAAMALADTRAAADQRQRFTGEVPGISRRKSASARAAEAWDDDRPPIPGQVRNEHGEWEDEASLNRRGAAAGESIAMKLLRIRRVYLSEISQSPGKRAAFEILTELPIDWDKAARGEPQADEPYNICNQRQPDMVLLNESGWGWGEIGYGPDRKREAREAIDAYRKTEGLEPIKWGAD